MGKPRFTDNSHTCARAYARARRAANPERAREYDRKRNATNPERNRAYARAWRKANPDRHRANTSAWLAANPERVRMHSRNGEARRRARIARVLATLTTAEWEAILNAADYACIYCGSRKQISIDHLTPIARGGDHTADNVAPACMPCNRSKGTQVVAEFLAETTE